MKTKWQMNQNGAPQSINLDYVWLPMSDILFEAAENFVTFLSFVIFTCLMCFMTPFLLIAD